MSADVGEGASPSPEASSALLFAVCTSLIVVALLLADATPASAVWHAGTGVASVAGGEGGLAPSVPGAAGGLGSRAVEPPTLPAAAAPMRISAWPSSGAVLAGGELAGPHVAALKCVSGILRGVS